MKKQVKSEELVTEDLTTDLGALLVGVQGLCLDSDQLGPGVRVVGRGGGATLCTEAGLGYAGSLLGSVGEGGSGTSVADSDRFSGWAGLENAQ